jgi:hypothetical protein
LCATPDLRMHSHAGWQDIYHDGSGRPLCGTHAPI